MEVLPMAREDWWEWEREERSEKWGSFFPPKLERREETKHHSPSFLTQMWGYYCSIPDFSNNRFISIVIITMKSMAFCPHPSPLITVQAYATQLFSLLWSFWILLRVVPPPPHTQILYNTVKDIEFILLKRKKWWTLVASIIAALSRLFSSPTVIEWNSLKL